MILCFIRRDTCITRCRYSLVVRAAGKVSRDCGEGTRSGEGAVNLIDTCTVWFLLMADSVDKRLLGANCTQRTPAGAPLGALWDEVFLDGRATAPEVHVHAKCYGSAGDLVWWW